MNDNTIICVIDKTKTTLHNAETKIPRLESGDSMDNSSHDANTQTQGGFHVVKKYKVKKKTNT